MILLKMVHLTGHTFQMVDSRDSYRFSPSILLLKGRTVHRFPDNDEKGRVSQSMPKGIAVPLGTRYSRQFAVAGTQRVNLEPPVF